MRSELPDFRFEKYSNSTYHFGRTKDFGEHTVYEDLHINFSLKERIISCSISSNINPAYRFTSSYESSMLNSHFDLLTLKQKTGIAPVKEAYYFHNGRVNSTTEIIEELVKDYSTVGIKFLDTRSKLLPANKLLKVGLSFIMSLSYPKEELKKEFETELRVAGHLVSRIKHPLYFQLKKLLQEIPDQTNEVRQEIPGLAFSLLEYYYENKAT